MAEVLVRATLLLTILPPIRQLLLPTDDLLPLQPLVLLLGRRLIVLR